MLYSRLNMFWTILDVMQHRILICALVVYGHQDKYSQYGKFFNEIFFIYLIMIIMKFYN